MHDDLCQTSEYWVNLLSISSRLLFDHFRTLAVKELTSLSARFTSLDKVRLALQYDIDAWLEPAYRSIILDKKILSFEDAGKLPWETAALLFRCREIYHSQKPASSAAHGASFATMTYPSSNFPMSSGGASCFGVPEDQLTAHKRDAESILAEQLDLLRKYRDDLRVRHS